MCSFGDGYNAPIPDSMSFGRPFFDERMYRDDNG
jgi:hypothetical protein